ncbi:MAG: hypothetical protein AAFX39_01990 [Pseudomonadota bacterium]
MIAHRSGRLIEAEVFDALGNLQTATFEIAPFHPINLFGFRGDVPLTTLADDMSGGSGKDTFDFNARSDSGTTGSSRDDITDFSRGADDVIDLRDLASGKLDFRDERNFKRNNDNQLRLEDRGDDIRVEIDFNGDRRADCAIDVEDINRLKDSDFLL